MARHLSPLGQPAAKIVTSPIQPAYVSPRALASALRQGRQIPDEHFDRLAAGAGRLRHHLIASTPLSVASSALSLLTAGEALRVLDVGAGVGKLCIVGALTTRAQFTGVEHHLALVRQARSAALRFGARRATFIHDSVAHIDLQGFDAIYVFDGAPESPASSTSVVWRKLPAARSGTRIVTYGGLIDPPGCRLHARLRPDEGALALFIKE
jgi:hypothetical protein